MVKNLHVTYRIGIPYINEGFIDAQRYQLKVIPNIRVPLQYKYNGNPYFSNIAEQSLHPTHVHQIQMDVRISNFFDNQVQAANQEEEEESLDHRKCQILQFFGEITKYDFFPQIQRHAMKQLRKKATLRDNIAVSNNQNLVNLLYRNYDRVEEWSKFFVDLNSLVTQGMCPEYISINTSETRINTCSMFDRYFDGSMYQTWKSVPYFMVFWKSLELLKRRAGALWASVRLDCLAIFKSLTEQMQLLPDIRAADVIFSDSCRFRHVRGIYCDCSCI